jgi:hypothetical protein
MIIAKAIHTVTSLRISFTMLFTAGPQLTSKDMPVRAARMGHLCL